MNSTRHVFALAAFLAAGSPAYAIDPVEYVRICDAFGTGFYYIPGSDTCLKIGGYVRVESHWVDGDPGLGNTFDNWTTRTRGNIDLDTRTETGFGLLRSYIALQLTVGPTFGDDEDSSVDPNYDGSEPEVAAAFIEITNDWGMFTAGHTASFFDFFGSHGYGTRLIIDDNTGEQTLFAWTLAPPTMPGLSFTVSAEDPASGGRRLNGADDYEGQEFPDGVGNIRYDGKWGSAAVMGVVRHLNDDNGDGLGFAVGAGLSVGIGGDWAFDAQGGYSEGAFAYLTTDPGGIGDLEGPTGDDTNSVWVLRGGFTGPVGHDITVWLDGSYSHAEQQTAGTVEYDFWATQIGAAWEPVAGLTIGPEFAYNRLDFDAGGADQDTWGVMWRIERAY